MKRLAALFFGMLMIITPVIAMDKGQWANADPEVVEWFKSLKQPDSPMSCCGEADAYWADSYEMSKDGNYIAIITDDRPDEPLKRHHIPIGTRIEVPNFKMKFDRGNPTGHGIIFINQGVVIFLNDGKQHTIDVKTNSIDNYVFVFCFLPPGGT